MKNIIVLVSCLVATSSFSTAHIPEEPEQSSITQTQAITISTLFGMGTACLVTIGLNTVPPVRTFSSVVLNSQGMASGMVGGAIGLKTGQLIYGWLQSKNNAEVHIHIKK